MSLAWPSEVRTGPLINGRSLPLLVEPKGTPPADPPAWCEGHRELLRSALDVHGAVLLRGFGIATADTFRSCLRAVAGELLEYRERSSPRREIGERIFTSTEYPAEREIFLHSEQSYNLHFPRVIAFFCVRPADDGGRTPIADTRKILQRIRPAVVESLVARRYTYVRNFDGRFGLPWKHSFQVDTADRVEEYCGTHGIDFEWVGGRGEVLRTRQVRDVVAVHPRTGERVWFNHLAFFHPTTLDPDLQQLLLLLYGRKGLPHATCYGDGEEIEDEVAAHIRDAYRQEAVELAWETGDLLLLDNLLTAHGRTRYRGDREVLVGMSALTSWDEVRWVPPTRLASDCG